MVAHQGAYSGTREAQALAWIEEVTGMSFDGDEFGIALQDGVGLATLANALVPGTIRKVSHSRMPFPQRENISAFIEAARMMGVPEHQLFETSDLFVLCIKSLRLASPRAVPLIRRLSSLCFLPVILRLFDPGRCRSEQVRACQPQIRGGLPVRAWESRLQSPALCRPRAGPTTSAAQ